MTGVSEVQNSDREARSVLEGLRAEEPSVDARYFHDDRGSELFEQITRLPEYYQTRTELALLEQVAGVVVKRARPLELVELGSGAGRKVHLLLDAMEERELLQGCVLLDINRTFLDRSVDRLAASYPGLEVRGVVSDFMQDLGRVGRGPRRMFILLAGTIGNLHPDEVPAFLGRVHDQMRPDDWFLVGVDLVKDRSRLEAAYNDSAGVTAALNRNMLRVLNDRFGTDFDPAGFEHEAIWDDDREWIEMRLRARRPMRVTMPGQAGHLVLESGRHIRTELSCKYTRASFAHRVQGSGLVLDSWLTDPEEHFAEALLRRSE